MRTRAGWELSDVWPWSTERNGGLLGKKNGSRNNSERTDDNMQMAFVDYCQRRGRNWFQKALSQLFHLLIGPLFPAHRTQSRQGIAVGGLLRYPADVLAGRAQISRCKRLHECSEHHRGR